MQRKNQQSAPPDTPKTADKIKDNGLVVKRRRGVMPLSFKGLDGKHYTLTPKQKYWCDTYLEEGANLTTASLEVYKVTNKHLCKIPWKLLSDKEKRRRMGAEDVAHQIGKENFGKPRIFNYINKILSDEGYTDDVVQLEHFKNIKQDRSLSAKNAALDMYYKKRGSYAPEERKDTVTLVELVKYAKPKSE